MAKKGKQHVAGGPREGRRGGAGNGLGQLAGSPVSLNWLLRGPVQTLVLGCLIYLWFGPLFQINLASWRSHSPSFDLARAVATADAWRGGLWDGRWFAGFDGGFGYPFLSFYAPLCSWGAALLIVLGNSPPVAIALNLILWLCLGTTGMYLAASRFWRYLTDGRSGAVMPGLTAAVGWLMSPYLLCNVYVRGDGPEFIASQVLPWILYAGWGVLMRGGGWGRRDWRDLLVGALAVATAVLSHNFLAMAAVGFAMALAPLAMLLRMRAADPASRAGLAVRWRDLALRAGVWGCAVGWGMAATIFFWLPGLREGKYVRTEAVMGGGLNYARHFLYWSNLASIGFWGTGDSVPGPNDGMPLHLGFVSLLALLSVAVAAALALSRRHRDRRFGWSVIATAAFTFAALLLTHRISKPIWDHVKIMQYGQFSWRLLIVPTVGVCLLLPALPVALRVLSLRAPWRQTGMIGWGVALFCCYLMSYLCYYNQLTPDDPPRLLASYPNFRASDLYDATRWNSLFAEGHLVPINTALRDEYGPIWRVPWRPALHAPGTVMFNPPLKVLAGDDTRYSIRLVVENPTSEAQSLAIAYNYYPAWQVWSEPRCPDLSLAPTPETGFIQVQHIPPGKSTIHVYYGNTPLRAWTKALAGCFWLIWLLGAAALALGHFVPLARRRRSGQATATESLAQRESIG